MLSSSPPVPVKVSAPRVPRTWRTPTVSPPERDGDIVGGIGVEALRMRRIDVLQVEVVGDILERVVVNAGDGRGDGRADAIAVPPLFEGVSAHIGMGVVVTVEIHARTDVLEGIAGHIELARRAVRPDSAVP